MIGPEVAVAIIAGAWTSACLTVGYIWGRSEADRRAADREAVTEATRRAER